MNIESQPKETRKSSLGNDMEVNQRVTNGLALAYHLFNVADLIQSLVRGHGEGRRLGQSVKMVTTGQAVSFDAMASAERSYVGSVAALKRLDAEEELAVARRMRSGDDLAKNLLVSANLGLVVMFARKYSRTGASMIDLIAEGNIALLQATRTFDPERGFRFATYAKRPVTQAMVSALPRLTGAMTTPMPKQTQAGAASSMETESFKTSLNGTSDDREAISETYMHGYADSGPIPDASELPADEEHEPANQVSDLLRNKTLRRAMECLNAREREIVSARFGLDELEPETLASLATRFEISIERVRQIENAGLKRLARHFDQTGHSLGTML